MAHDSWTYPAKVGSRPTLIGIFCFLKIRYNRFMRLIKQLFFGSAFLVFVFGGIFAIWRYNTDRPTCFDGLKNGDEEGIDCGLLACGAVCPPPVIDLEVQDAKIVKTNQGEYDIVVRVYNPNSTYGSPKINYSLIFRDLSERELFRESRSFYILPGQTKFLVTAAIKSVDEIKKIEVQIKEVNWRGYNPVGTVRFPLISQQRRIIDGQSQLFGVIRNDSEFDFDQVEVRAIARGQDGEIVSAGVAPILTFRSKTDRHFILIWPYEIPNFQEALIDVEIDTDLFTNSNFLKIYGGDYEPFQKFY
jgi:hypothetical protein